ncbi:EutN/CcmL family microcompartment protein [Bacillus marasmi]|uniref:EutN/CcmL family microcompartment protein n=1 Tax=Bacillus marasmi TaxID=1926279 RepID=UPI0011C7BE48|nr:EutN/CcmL family microcompartment protein [Bacillus marasmi]
MFLAKVIGSVVSTQKVEKLVGGKLMVIKTLDEKKSLVDEPAMVAIDAVGAGVGDVVLVDWGDSIYEDSKLSADMAIVGIVDEIQVD